MEQFTKDAENKGFSPSSFDVFTADATGLNSGNDVWYGYGAEDIDCSSYSAILSKYGYTFDESWNAKYTYTIENNNGYNVVNNDGEWERTLSY